MGTYRPGDKLPSGLVFRERVDHHHIHIGNPLAPLGNFLCLAGLGNFNSCQILPSPLALLTSLMKDRKIFFMSDQMWRRQFFNALSTLLILKPTMKKRIDFLFQHERLCQVLYYYQKINKREIKPPNWSWNKACSECVVYCVINRNDHFLKDWRQWVKLFTSEVVSVFFHQLLPMPCIARSLLRYHLDQVLLRCKPFPVKAVPVAWLWLHGTVQRELTKKVLGPLAISWMYGS